MRLETSAGNKSNLCLYKLELHAETITQNYKFNIHLPSPLVVLEGALPPSI